MDYDLARLHVNVFQPVEKLVSKTRAGARTRRYYDPAQAPYQRLCALQVLSPTVRADLAALYHRRSNCRATSRPRSNGCGPSPRPIRTAPRGMPRQSPLAQGRSWRLLDDAFGNPEL